MRNEVGNKDEAREIALWSIHDGRFYRQTEGVRLNLAKKVYKGIFEKELAVEFIAKTWVPVATKMYDKEFSNGDGGIKLSPATRKLAAAEILDHWMEEIEGIAEDIRAGHRDKRGNLKKPDTLAQSVADSLKSFGIEEVQIGSERFKIN